MFVDAGRDDVRPMSDARLYRYILKNMRDTDASLGAIDRRPYAEQLAAFCASVANYNRQRQRAYERVRYGAAC